MAIYDSWMATEIQLSTKQSKQKYFSIPSPPLPNKDDAFIQRLMIKFSGLVFVCVCVCFVHFPLCILLACIRVFLKSILILNMKHK